MAKYISHYSGKRIDRSVGMIPDTNPDEESILVISSDGKGSYKKVSEVVVQATGEATDKVMSQDATTKELSKKLNLIEPSGVQTDFVMVKKGFDGTIEQVQETGVFTPDTEYRIYKPVLRGLHGQLRGQTAPSGSQNDLDLINRRELTEKLGEVGGGLKWVDYSAEIPRVNVYAVIVGLGNTGQYDGTDRCPLPPILTFDGNLMMGGIKYPYDLYREDFNKTGGKGTFYLTKSGVGYAQQATLENQVKADGASFDWNVCEIMKMLVKE